jgi:hypothetical protein
MLANRLKLIKMAVEMDDSSVVDYLISNTDFTQRISVTSDWVPRDIPFECTNVLNFWNLADTIAELLCILPYNETLINIMNLYLDLDVIIIDDTTTIEHSELAKHLFTKALTYDYEDVFEKLYKLCSNNDIYVRTLFNTLAEKDVNIAFKIFKANSICAHFYYINNKELLTLILDNKIRNYYYFSIEYVRHLVSLDYIELAKHYISYVKSSKLPITFMKTATTKELLFFNNYQPKFNLKYCKNSHLAGLSDSQTSKILETTYNTIKAGYDVNTCLDKLSQKGVTINKKTKKICCDDYELDLTPEFIEAIDNYNLRRDLNIILQDIDNFLHGSKYVT